MVDRRSIVELIFKNKSIFTLIHRIVVIYFAFLFLFVSYTFHCYLYFSLLVILFIVILFSVTRFLRFVLEMSRKFRKML